MALSGRRQKVIPKRRFIDVIRKHMQIVDVGEEDEDEEDRKR